MVKSGKSLKDSLKELENPASTCNFEDSGDELTFAKIAEGQGEENDNNNELKIFGNLRKKVALQEEHFEEKYSGSKISRRKIADWSEDESDDESGDDVVESDEELNTNKSENDTSEDDENEVNKKGIDDEMDEEIESGKDEEDSDQGDDRHEEMESEEEEIKGEEEDESDYIDDDDDGALNLDISKIPKDLLGGQVDENDVEEDIDVDNFSASNKTSDKKKGEATKHQLDLLDKLLESRIRLQKSVQLANTLPQKENVKLFLKEGGPQIQQSYQDVKSSIFTLLSNLLKLQQELFENNKETEQLLSGDTQSGKIEDDEDEEIPSDTDDEINEDEDKKKDDTQSLNLPSKRKRKLNIEDYEEELSKRHKQFCTFRDTTITKWFDKTRLMTGKTKGFSAFETSTLQQIKQVLSDKERLVKRSQLKRTLYNILGKVEEDTSNNDDHEVDPHLKNYDEEIFDDSDFYHEMLKELIERKSNLSSNDDDPVASGRRWLELQKLRTKVKRKIDTRASKGRKVRYDVHQKLVSFMAPQEVGLMSDQARNDLFSSLFG